MLSNYLTAESTSIEFKESLNATKPKSWLKTISAFANTEGGSLIFGVSDKKIPVGIEDIQDTTTKIAEIINAHIEPVPQYQLIPLQEEGLDFLRIEVAKGTSTPYYYSSNGTRVAYIRLGDESIIAPQHVHLSLILRGMNQTFDALPSPYKLGDVSFTYLQATFRQRLHDMTISERDLASFGLALPDGHITYAGALLCDQYVVSQSRVFCTRWKNLTKGTVGEDALDDKEYEGNVLFLLENAELFVKNHSKKSWAVRGMLREEREEYPLSSVREALINALVHRDYQILGSEIHVDMFPDRLEITSPGGMVDGSKVQSLNISEIPSMRRNKILSDVLSRLEIMERRGSGLTRIYDGYAESEVKPMFYSDISYFRVTLPNMQYSVDPVMEEEMLPAEIVERTLSENEHLILACLSRDPSLTMKAISEMTGLSKRQIRYGLDLLKEKGVLVRVGSNRAGYWKITGSETQSQ